MNAYVPAYKIGSGDLTWRAMFDKLTSQGKPYFLACGAPAPDEAIEAIGWTFSENTQFGVMQCNTSYRADH